MEARAAHSAQQTIRRMPTTLIVFLERKHNMTNLQITYKAIKDLIPYVNNSRTHSDEQVMQVASSIKEFGFTNPILLDGKSGIIAGHGRLLAAKKLGLEQVPTIELSHLSDVQKKAYVIADNKLALNAGWDNEILALELKDLADLGFDLELTGFSEGELKNYLDEDSDADESDGDGVSDESRNTLLIECIGERELEKLYEEMQQRGFECKILS